MILYQVGQIIETISLVFFFFLKAVKTTEISIHSNLKTRMTKMKISRTTAASHQMKSFPQIPHFLALLSPIKFY